MEAYTVKIIPIIICTANILLSTEQPMSKSRGNIIYPESLVAAGADWRDLRFYLTYTHYRKKLNYTKTAFDKPPPGFTSLELCLHDIRRDDRSGTGSREAETLIDSIPGVFETELDNDLSLGAGFDAVFSKIAELSVLSRAEPLTAGAYKSLNKNIEKLTMF